MDVSSGFYSTPTADPESLRWDQLPCPLGRYCSGGLQRACPPGRFGNVTSLPTAACSGLCAAGHYCTGAAVTAYQVECASGVAIADSVYCPAGSAAPTLAVPGEYTLGGSPSTRWTAMPCRSGSFCVNGTARPCPAGRFGCADRLTDDTCNGPCTAGSYCPSGSTTSQPYVE